MGSCEMCGKSTDNLRKVKIAGSIVNVCNNCSSMGKEENPIDENNSYSFYKRKNIEIEQVELVNNYVSLINSTLAKKGLTVHHLARALNIKESTLHKVLTNKFDLEINLARKIENFLDIKLVETTDDNSPSELDLNEIIVDKKENNLNLADLIKEQLKNKNNK